MAIRHTELFDLVTDTCTFPADRATIEDRVGGTELVSPHGETVTLASVMRQGEQDGYESALEFHNTVLSQLGESFVGRKAYDDRSSNHGRDTNVSL
ncbi:hypothetical protein [Haloarchaeobius amylolyticus]|uniref:DUF5789 family protein n=1 Tax=Haloarchaeobius amylolyticus TaxID=1198296 RepID=UPI00226FBD3A|nr:hypothetical protein [Haloarchaeobius amylolyticus]